MKYILTTIIIINTYFMIWNYKTSVNIKNELKAINQSINILDKTTFMVDTKELSLSDLKLLDL